MTLSTRYPLLASAKRIAQNMSGRSSAQLLSSLDEQVRYAQDGANVLTSLTSNAVTTSDARRQISVIEHSGDHARSQLILKLGTALVTPIDAEDIFRLSRAVDDILDNLRDFIREADLYAPSDCSFATLLAATIGTGISHLRLGVASLSGAGAHVREETLVTRKAAGQVRHQYQNELAIIFGNPLSDDSLKKKELLGRLDAVGIRLGEAADVLADATLKRGR